MEKSEGSLLTASAAVDSETGKDGAFWDRGELDGKRKTGKMN
jgi:hypothetical protein